MSGEKGGGDDEDPSRASTRTRKIGDDDPIGPILFSALLIIAVVIIFEHLTSADRLRHATYPNAES